MNIGLTRRDSIKKFGYLIMVAALSVILASCAAAPVKPSLIPSKETFPEIAAPILRQDISHVVAPGETLWRLSKMYDVPMDDIVRINNLKSRTELEIGQRLLIPGAAPIRPIVPLYLSNKWKYIIIHHSATDEGSALSFNVAHYSRGFWNGLGYHFVIDNGTKGKLDGQMEVSPRWLKQQDGSHCKAGGMNYKGIGICLVGNFNKEDVSEKQMESLVYLINILRDYYNIPIRNILGHGQVPGAKTECPGKKFPWKEFYKRLQPKTDG